MYKASRHFGTTIPFTTNGTELYLMVPKHKSRGRRMELLQ